MASSSPIAPREISRTDFALFADYFYRQTGIHFPDSKRYFVDKRLSGRLEATHQPDVASYPALLRSSEGRSELQALINALTVNETYFFRESSHFDSLVNVVLDEIVGQRDSGHTLRMWTVPCSTGEEPYSLALTLLERWPGLESVDVEIIASDIDTNVLDHCARGRYVPRSVQNVDARTLSKYFRRDGEEYVLSRDVVDAVSFRRINLVDPRSTSSMRGFDVVFCRNLFIYFDEPARRMAAQAIFDALLPGGFLFLGQMESIGRVSGLFEVVRRGDCVIYRKPDGK